MPSGQHSFKSISIEGTLEVKGDVILYSEADIDLLPGGKIIACGNSGDPNGYNIELHAKGNLNLYGLIDTSGADGVSITDGKGGNGGRVVIKTYYYELPHNPGMLSLGSIVTRGGDADVTYTGGNGGNISIIAHLGDISFVKTLPLTPDTIPPDHLKLGACSCPTNKWPCSYIRKNDSQVIPIPLKRTYNTTEFSSGLLTSGGMGGNPGKISVSGSKGGNGGNITIDCISGTINFNGIDLYTGAGIENVCASITYYDKSLDCTGPTIMFDSYGPYIGVGKDNICTT